MMLKYLWHHGVDLNQDAVIEAAMQHWKRTTGATVDRHTMLKLIIMQYGEELAIVNRELKAEELAELGLLGPVSEDNEVLAVL